MRTILRFQITAFSTLFFITSCNSSKNPSVGSFNGEEVKFEDVRNYANSGNEFVHFLATPDGKKAIVKDYFNYLASQKLADNLGLKIPSNNSHQIRKRLLLVRLFEHYKSNNPSPSLDEVKRYYNLTLGHLPEEEETPLPEDQAIVKNIKEKLISENFTNWLIAKSSGMPTVLNAKGINRAPWDSAIENR